MKIAAIAYNTEDPSVHAMLQYWLLQAKKHTVNDDLVVITDEASKKTTRWKNVVVAEPLEDFRPLYRTQNIVRGEYYKAQAFRLLQEPVIAMDLDCIIQTPLEVWKDQAMRMTPHNPGTASDFERIDGFKFRHMNMGLVYHGRDCFDAFKEIFEKVRVHPRYCDSYMIGEFAMSYLAGKEKWHALPQEYCWFANSKPVPENVFVKHYGRDARPELMKQILRHTQEKSK